MALPLKGHGGTTHRIGFAEMLVKCNTASPSLTHRVYSVTKTICMQGATKIYMNENCIFENRLIYLLRSFPTIIRKICLNYSHKFYKILLPISKWQELKSKVRVLEMESQHEASCSLSPTAKLLISNKTVKKLS